MYEAEPGETDLRAKRSRRLRIGEVLITQRRVSERDVEHALHVQQVRPKRLGALLVEAGKLSFDDVAVAVAEQTGIPLAAEIPVEAAVAAAALVPEDVARHYNIAPFATTDGGAAVVAPDPLSDNARAALAHLGQGRFAEFIGGEEMVEQLRWHGYRQQRAEQATSFLMQNCPEESAHRVLSRRQSVVLIAVLAAFVGVVAWSPRAGLLGINVIALLLYLAIAVYKLRISVAATGAKGLDLPVSAEELVALNGAELPRYTLLVPLYKEVEVLPRLLESIARLDYPDDKLDVKLLLEEDDRDTIEAVAARGLPSHVHALVVPDSQPKTKPKACNFGLRESDGEFIVIYDAEDRPDPDQLRKAIVAFRKAGPELGCVQCKLNYYNADQNLLTRWFTIEYSTWFHLLLPGLSARRAPIPLGGTSNHFRRSTLIELGGWDPFNVTEDADLGIRLHKRGYTTAVIDSTTYEEANSRVGNWLRQRSRWAKGYVQTWLVHMRHPIALGRDLGWRDWWSFQMVVGGTAFSTLINPIYWLLTLLWVLTNSGFIASLFPGVVYFIGSVGLFIGNFVFAYLNLLGALTRGKFTLVKYAVLTPFYWVLMSIAGWKGFIQLFSQPFYWEKTMHGLDRSARTQASEHVRPLAEMASVASVASAAEDEGLR